MSKHYSLKNKTLLQLMEISLNTIMPSGLTRREEALRVARSLPNLEVTDSGEVIVKHKIPKLNTCPDCIGGVSGGGNIMCPTCKGTSEISPRHKKTKSRRI